MLGEEVVNKYRNDAQGLAEYFSDEYFAKHKRVFPINPFQVLADLNIKFVFKNFKKLEGLYLPSTEESPVELVAINANKPITRQRFSAVLPDGLLYEGSVIHQLITEIPEEDWKDAVQIIGWMYQYYNTEPKDEVFEGLKKNVKITKDKIPAATQIFTPDWIVRYMVENSLGRLWLEGHQNSNLKSNWRYYLDEANQMPEIQTELDSIRTYCSKLKLEEIKCIDPCMGSGHILCYMFDVLEQIYENSGYNSRDAVESIVNNNLFGLDIDERAAQLAYFSIMMKARQYDKRVFSRNQQPHVLAIAESKDIPEDVVDYFANKNNRISEAASKMISCLKNACELGSLLSIPSIDFKILYNRIDEIKAENSLYRIDVLESILPLIQVSEILSQKYNVVITNPPKEIPLSPSLQRRVSEDPLS